MLSKNGKVTYKISKVGVFDSGLGGLTVLEELLKHHPHHSYVYYGDTAHVPYGSREARDVIRLVTDIARYLVGQGCEALVLACNTSSALAMSALRTTVDVPVIGVISTASREAARVSRGRIGVLANPLTAQSGVYRQKIETESRLQGLSHTPEVVEIGCPDLVPIVEEGTLHTPEAAQILGGYAARLKKEKIDTLVLGCTHYPLLLPVFGPLLGEDMNIINPADLIPEYLDAGTEGEGQISFKVSGDPDTFVHAAGQILGRTIVADKVFLKGATAS